MLTLYANWMPWLILPKNSACEALDFIRDRSALLGWLSGFWAQTGPVANCRFPTFFRHSGEPMAGLMIVRGSAPTSRCGAAAPGRHHWLLPTRDCRPQLPKEGRSRVDITLIKPNSSCLSMMLRQELLYTRQDTGLPMRPAALRAGTTEPVRTSLCPCCP